MGPFFSFFLVSISSLGNFVGQDLQFLGLHRGSWILVWYALLA